jgi:hypothetical protein
MTAEIDAFIRDELPWLLMGVQRGLGLDLSTPPVQQRSSVASVDLHLFPGVARAAESDEVA